MSMILKDFYPASEFASMKGRSLKSVYRWVKQGIAPDFENIGGMYFFYKTPADKWEPPQRGRKKA